MCILSIVQWNSLQVQAEDSHWWSLLLGFIVVAVFHPSQWSLNSPQCCFSKCKNAPQSSTHLSWIHSYAGYTFIVHWNTHRMSMCAMCWCYTQTKFCACTTFVFLFISVLKYCQFPTHNAPFTYYSHACMGSQNQCRNIWGRSLLFLQNVFPHHTVEYVSTSFLRRLQT